MPSAHPTRSSGSAAPDPTLPQQPPAEAATQPARTRNSGSVNLARLASTVVTFCRSSDSVVTSSYVLLLWPQPAHACGAIGEVRVVVPHALPGAVDHSAGMH